VQKGKGVVTSIPEKGEETEAKEERSTCSLLGEEAKSSSRGEERENNLTSKGRWKTPTIGRIGYLSGGGKGGAYHQGEAPKASRSAGEKEGKRVLRECVGQRLITGGALTQEEKKRERIGK